MRDFIFDNFEEEEKDALLNNVSVVKPTDEKVKSVVESTEEKYVESVSLDKLTDEQQDKLFTVLGEGLNKILKGLASFDDDDIPF